jgi:branched-chain amino acid transport system substrate-binding protein
MHACTLRALTAATLTVCALAAAAADAPGVSATEIKVGHTNALSGPAAQYGLLARANLAYFKMVNDAGGINGRRINLLVADDEYSPPKSIEAARKLVEQDQVALMYGSFGTPTQSAQAPYLNRKGVPHLFLGTGADKWSEHKAFPWSMGFQPSFRTEARLYTKHLLERNAKARIGVLYQNDDFGKDYVKGVQDELAALEAKNELKTLSYESADTTIDSQIVSLQGAGVDVLVLAAIPKFSAQAIRKIYELGWKPTVYVSLGAAGVPTTTEPAKGKTGLVLLSGAFAKQPNDSAWAVDAGVKQYLEFMKKYMPGEDVNNPLPVLGFNTGHLLVDVLRRAGSDLSRDNIRKQAESIKGVALPMLLPGITVDTSPTDHAPIEQVQITRWDGTRWVPQGGVISIAKAH